MSPERSQNNRGRASNPHLILSASGNHKHGRTPIKKRIALLLTGTLLVLGAGCEMVGFSADSGGDAKDQPLVGPTWQLIAFVESDGNRTPVTPEYERPQGNSAMPYYCILFTQESAKKHQAVATPNGAWFMDVRTCAEITMSTPPNVHPFTLKSGTGRGASFHHDLAGFGINPRAVRSSSARGRSPAQPR